MQSRMSDAEQRYQAVIGQVTTDAGLMMDRARYLRESGYEQAARDLFARAHKFTHKPADPDRFLDMMVLLSKAAAGRRWQTAYIASQVEDVFPAGADISLKSYDIRDKYTTLTWTAGSIALERMNRGRDAIGMFDKYAGAGRSLQVKTKAGTGPAGLRRRRATICAAAAISSAAATPELFYGQLALERLGRIVPAPAGTPSLLMTDAQRQAFNQKRLVRAVRLLGQQRLYSEQSLFVRASPKTSTAMRSGCWRSSSERRSGGRTLRCGPPGRRATPATPSITRRPIRPIRPMSRPAPGRWSMALPPGVELRQGGGQPCGSAGMMQLMPGTAREQAGKMGLGYDYGGLTSSPSYNVMLGSAYFSGW